MNVDDPGDRDHRPDRPEPPLPRRTPTAAALYALRPVPSPRTPGDGPVRRASAAGPVPRPRDAAPAVWPRPATPPSSATTEPVPAARSADRPPRTPPMPWTAVGPVPAATPAGRRRGLRILESGIDRRVGLALAVAVVLVAAAALVLSGTTRSGAPTAPTPAADGAPDLAAGAAVVDAAAFGPAGEPSFRSPTGNIGCRMAGDEVRCTVANRSWSPDTPDCPPDAPGGVVLTRSGPAVAACGAVGAEAARTLDYGSALRLGAVTCVSRRDGVECRDGSSGHGFAVARSAYRVY